MLLYYLFLIRHFGHFFDNDPRGAIPSAVRVIISIARAVANIDPDNNGSSTDVMAVTCEKYILY